MNKTADEITKEITTPLYLACEESIVEDIQKKIAKALTEFAQKARREAEFSALKARVERLEKVLREIAKGTHMFWESRGMDQRQHCENCPPCLAKAALSEAEGDAS